MVVKYREIQHINIIIICIIRLVPFFHFPLKLLQITWGYCLLSDDIKILLFPSTLRQFQRIYRPVKTARSQFIPKQRTYICLKPSLNQLISDIHKPQSEANHNLN